MSLYTLILLKTPSIFPNFNFPGSKLIFRLIGVVMGIIVLVLIAKFAGAMKDIPDAMESGNGGSIAIRVFSIVAAIAILFAGTAFLFSWVGFFHVR
jgi:hypothetical protein